MSSSHYACYGDVVEEDFVKEICSSEFDDLQVFLENHGSGIEELGVVWSSGEWPSLDEVENSEEQITVLESLWVNLVKTFEKRTGLSLCINYFNAEERGDEVTGVFWTVDNVYTYTPAGEKYKSKITRKSWVDFG